MKNSCFPLAYRKVAYRKALQNCIRPTLALGLIALTCASSHLLHAQAPKELHIAAASDLQPVLPTLAAEYEQATGIKIIASFGSSATLTQQLTNGDPQDLFLSADYAHPEQLVAANLTTSNAPTPYAHGVLVAWARHDSPAQPLTLDSLTSPKVQKIAIANQLHAPYGLAATQALQSLRLTDKVASKLVVAENIAQTAQFAESGNAQVALISLTIASSPHFRELGSFVRFAPGSYSKMIQCAVILKSSKNQTEAQNFLHWLTSNEVQQSLTKFGLDPAN
jgi:molybdate transport system substrate-binding protein